MNCEHCRQQLLPFLYDLLDPQERVEVAAHLESCADCQDVMRAAQETAGLLAEAVKEEHADIVFKAPVKITPASMAPTVVMQRPSRRLLIFNRWAIAASILFLLFLTGSVIGWTVWREQAENLDKAQQQLAKAKRDLSNSQGEWNQQKGATQKEIRAIQQQLDHLYKDWQSEEIKKRTDLENKRVQITVNGPSVAQAGAPNTYQVQAFRGNDVITNTAQAPGLGKLAKDQSALPGMKLNVRAYSQGTSNKAKTPLFEQDVVTQGDGKADVVLPSDLPITPGDEIFLEFNGRNEEGVAVKLRDDLKLVFPEFVTHLATDRPMYRPGETVRFRSLTLERFSLKPAQQAFHLRYRIVGPNGQPIFTKEVASQLVSNRNLDEPIRDGKGAPLLGVGVGEFALPVDLAGGSYTLYASEVNDRFYEEKRTFLVHDWQAPRLNKELQFHRSSYGPGDQVQMQVRVVPVQGMARGMGGNVQLAAECVVDGVKFPIGNLNTDQDGKAVFNFHLPPQIFKGVGAVTLTCSDGGNTETLVRSIPIVLRDLQIDFYPEGGDLIAGLPNRVYFQARTPANRPADIEGRVVDDKGKVVARIKTVTDDKEPGINQGLGSFTFTPQGTKPYTLRIDSPIGIDRTFALPTAKMKGVVLTIPTGVVEDEVAVTLQSAKLPRELLVGVYCRGRMLDHKFVKAPANVPTPVTLKPQAGVGGVYRITVFEKLREGGNIGYRPLAERLVYRKNAALVDVEIQSDRQTYQPGDTVELNLQARNEKKEFVPAYALVAVVDQSVLKLADEKTARAMPTHFLLTTEIRDPEDLEYADFLLGPHPKAAASLDLLLGCQGWRRFAEQNPQDFQRRQQQAKPPIFLANAGAGPQLLEAEQKEIENLDQVFIPKAIELEKTLAEKEKQELGPPQARKNVDQMQTSVQIAENMQMQADARVREVRAFLIQFGLGGLLLTLLFLGFFLISVGLRRLAEGGHARMWFTMGLGLLGFLFFASVLGTFALMGERLIDDFGRGAMKRDVAPPANPNNMLPNANFPVAPNVEPIIDDEPLQPDAEKDDVNRPRIGVNQRGPRNFVPPPQKEAFNNNEVVVNFQQAEMNQDRLLRQQGNYQAIVQKQIGRRVQLPAVRDPSVVREFAYEHKALARNEIRRDFAETIYWHPVLALPDGQASVKFDLSDSVTRFQVLVLSHTTDGRLGANRIEITSKLPFAVEPKVPLEVTNTDQIAIPVAVSNASAKPISATVSARVKGLTLQDGTDRGLNLGPNQNKREVFHVKPSITEGNAAIRIAGRTSGSSDAVERRFKVVQDGFPITESVSGVLEIGNVEHTITLPPTWIAGSLQVRAQFYPSPLAELQTGLDALLREPAGCFEQSSSSNYPNVMILNYMKQQSGDKAAFQGNANFQPNPVLEKRARQLLQSGYQQLANFECVDNDHEGAKRGYEWFGGAAPPHEALTAYGLMQFRDMAKVYPVDEAMLKRTQQFLLDQRDKMGGFKRNPKGLDRFGRAPDHLTNAYILWALSEGAGNESLDAELAAVRASCKQHKDPYLLALAALSHLNRKKSAEAVALLQQLREHQKADGAIDGATTSITGSQGHDLRVETTALAVLAWIKADRAGEFGQNVTSAVKWLGQQRRGAGGFGATQATVLTLKALVAHAQKNPKVSQGGDVRLFVREAVGVDFQGNNFAQQNFAQRNFDQTEARGFFSPRSQDTLNLILPDPTIVRPGKNVVGLSVNGVNFLPYTLTWSYRTVKPANDPKAAVQIKTKLDRDRANEGETVKLTAAVENVSGKGQGMTVAIIGLPAGLALPEDFQQLKAYEKRQDNGTKPGKISAWELRGRELVLYWRDLAPDTKMELDLDLVCRLPGQYRGPASRAYLYYDADRKFWIAPLNIRIVEAE